MTAFIFDLDGTLVNSLEDIGQACNQTLAAHGYPVHPMNWRAHAHLFYCNWLNYYVYQETPFSLTAIARNRQSRSA
jgi:Homoserine trans-succinylase